MLYVGLWVDLERLRTKPCGGSGPYTITNPLFHSDVAAQSRAHDKLLNVHVTSGVKGYHVAEVSNFLVLASYSLALL